MADPLFRNFLETQITDLKNKIADPELNVEEVLSIADQIRVVEKRIHRIDNPVVRKPKNKPQTEA